MYPQPKNKPLRSKKHLDWIRNMPCAVCCAPPPSDPHHITNTGQGGMGTKPGDDFTIPLCRVCHTELHNNPTSWMHRNGSQESHLNRIKK